MGDLSDWNPLVDAASSGKLRLVRVLVEGGADVNGCDCRGDTPLLAACKHLQDDTATGSETFKLINYLLQNKVDPNAQDQAGRTALMLACLWRSSTVVSRLLSAGADPTLQDRCGASALVYAVKAQHPPTLKMIVEACRAKGRDVIVIIATDPTILNTEGPNRKTKYHLNLPIASDSTPSSCTSPSGVVLKTSAPNSPGGGNVFNFGMSSGRREAKSVSRQRGLSEPWLVIPDLAYLRQAFERGVTEREPNPGVYQSLLTLSDPPPDPRDEGWLPPCPLPRSWGRRSTMPELTLEPHALHLPPLRNKSTSSRGIDSKLACESVLFLPRPPDTAPPPSTKESVRAALLRPRQVAHMSRGQQSGRTGPSV